MNKREFIASASAGALAVAAGPAAGAPPAASDVTTTSLRRSPPLAGHQRLAAWRRYVGDEFVLGTGATLRLREITVSPHASGAVEQFRLGFEQITGPTPRAEAGPQALRHASGQVVDLHLQPAAAGRLQAHFALLA